MADRKGDPTKQPAECAPRFVPFSPSMPKDILMDAPNATGRWTQCPNLKEVGGGFEGERYECAVCGESYFLDYEEMR